MSPIVLFPSMDFHDMFVCQHLSADLHFVCLLRIHKNLTTSCIIKEMKHLRKGFLYSSFFSSLLFLLYLFLYSFTALYFYSTTQLHLRLGTIAFRHSVILTRTLKLPQYSRRLFYVCLGASVLACLPKR